MAKTSRKKKINVTAADLAAIQEAGIPSFTIEADSLFGLRCMVAVGQVAREMLQQEDASAVERVLREFEIYEESNRG